MGAGTRIGRAWKAAALLAVGAAGGGAALAVASVPGSDGVIHACVTLQQDGAPFSEGPNVRIIDPSAGQNCSTTSNPAGGPPSEANLTWNQVGPRGAVGPTGPQGKPGPPVVTLRGGNVITISGGTVLKLGSSHGLTINTPPVTRGSHAVGTLTLDLGGSTMSFDLFSFNLAGTHSGGGGGGAGKSSIHEIVVTMKLDKSSTKLALYCANGKHFPNATITLRKAGGTQPYLVIKMTQAIISSFETSGGSGGDKAPTESLSLNFTKVKYEYTKVS